jgi:transposase-like protein
MVTELKDRNKPRRGSASESQYSLFEFMREFPDDNACLDFLWRSRFSSDGDHALCPRCKVERKFRRYDTKQQRQSWTCTACGLNVHPTAGTIFEGSSTSLHLWFYGVYLMTSTRCGISAKQLERELGVGYKTAWRMFHRIRSLRAEDATDLDGTVEVDETYIGGKPRYHTSNIPKAVREGKAKKITVMGMVERGGRVRAIVNPEHPLVANVKAHVLPSALVYTDEAAAYQRLKFHGYAHSRVHHSMHVYVNGDVHTNTIEGFWSLVKRGIGGVYHSVSAKYLQMYLDEYSFRYNHRKDTASLYSLVMDLATNRA